MQQHEPEQIPDPPTMQIGEAELSHAPGDEPEQSEAEPEEEEEP